MQQLEIESESYTYSNNWGWVVAVIQKSADRHLLEDYGIEWELINPFTGAITYTPDLGTAQILAEGMAHIYRSYNRLVTVEEAPRSTRGGVWRNGRMAGLPVAYDTEGNAGVFIWEQFAPAVAYWWD
jgi:hypothetical protein